MMNKLYILPVVLVLLFAGCGKKEEKKRPPNVIVLFADDLGYGDFGYTGHPNIHTPNIDRLANAGVKFTNFYSGSPACSASRYALLTGKYPVRSGFDWVLYPKSERGLHEKEQTIAEVLKQAGYVTACYGKWHLGSTKPEYLPLQQGFDEYFGLPYSNDMRPPKWPSLPLLDGNDTLELDPDQSLLTMRYTEKAVDFIKKNRKKSFFIYLPYAMPHVPLYASEDFEGNSKRGLYGDVVEELDWSVGRIAQTVESLNLEKNTLILFASDNGPWIIKDLEGGSSGLFRDGKGSTWEGGMRVPAFAYWPGKIKDPVVDRNSYSVIDFLPTISRIGRAEEVPSGDGREIASIFDEDAQADEPFFYYGVSNNLHAVRKGSWKLHIKTSSQTGNQYFDDELPLLFNVDIDPSETQNVALENPDVVADLLNDIEGHSANVKLLSNFFDAP